MTPKRRSDRRFPTQGRPDRIVLGPPPGGLTSSRPPVRLFLGSAPRRFREERLFAWSVEKHRDPGRVYEIYLLRDLAGFSGRARSRGFRAYRFAVPEFAGFSGRALYHDIGRVYRADPARLFAQPMHDAGVLSAPPRDPSLMLIDCERMSKYWNRSSVNASSEEQLLAQAEREAGWGTLNRSETVGTPSRRLERHADRAGFLPFTAMRPSQDWAGLRLYLSSRPDGPRLLELLGPRVPDRYLEQRRVSGWLERVPDPDVPWVLARLLHLTGRLELRVREPLRTSGGRLRRDFGFWTEQIELAARLQPKHKWRLIHSAGMGRKQVCQSES